MTLMFLDSLSTIHSWWLWLWEIQIDSSLIASIPPYPARWKTNAVTVAGGNGQWERDQSTLLPCWSLCRWRSNGVHCWLGESSYCVLEDWCHDRWSAGRWEGWRVIDWISWIGQSMWLWIERRIVFSSAIERIDEWCAGLVVLILVRPPLPIRDRLLSTTSIVGGWQWTIKVLSMSVIGRNMKWDDMTREETRKAQWSPVVIDEGEGRHQLNRPTHLFVDGQSTLYISDTTIIV